MFSHKGGVIHVILFLSFQMVNVAADQVAVDKREPEWTRVGDCGRGLNCGPSCQLLCLKMHNYYRSLHGSPPLTCDHELAKSAQRWTDKQARDGKMHHSDWTDKYTESIAWKSWGWPGMEKMEGAIPGAVRGWYNEIKNGYNYRTGKGTGRRVVGHFRSVVWKAETKLGCGIRVVPNDGTYVTAHYAPASHATYEQRKLIPYNVLRRKRPDRSCHIRASQRQLCAEDLKAPLVTPQECLERGCCYDDTFLYEPKVVFYMAPGRIWCFTPK